MRIPICFLVVAALSSCVPVEETLTVMCPAACYTGPPGTEGVGECRAGVAVCDENKNVVACLGEVLPAERETCDGLDNTCEGLVDENLQLNPYDVDNTCGACGVCKGTWEKCDPETGTWFCDYQNGHPSPDDTTCDGVDDDCDCEIDEDVYAPGEIVFCYEGPVTTVATGECRPGVETCRNGQTVCDGQVVPRDEICDGRDNDCNGFVDDISSYYDGIDIVIAIDVSGSMDPYIDSVTNVICDYALATSNQPDTTLRLALVTIANPDGGFSLAQNMTTASIMCDALQDLYQNGGHEPTLSAAEAVVNPSNPLLINWTPNSKRIFIGFGDENAQVVCASTNTSLCAYEDTVINTLAYCTESNTDVYWFVASEIGPYLEQALGCNGDVFWLTTEESFMMDSLNTILSEVCLEGLPLP